MQDRGVPYDRHASYIVDEPGIDGGGLVDELIRVACLYEGVDPRIQIFANPAGGATGEQIDRMFEVVDVWDPI
jgi:hypothetical protein